MNDRSLLATFLAALLLAGVIGCSGEAVGDDGGWAEGTAGIADPRNRGDFIGDEIEPRGPGGPGRAGSQTHNTGGQGFNPSKSGGAAEGTTPGTTAGATGTGPTMGGH